LFAEQLSDKATEACQMYVQALGTFKQSYQIYNNLGNLYRQLDKVEEARAAYDRCIELKGDYACGYNNKGLLLISMGRFEEAHEAFAKALEIDPTLVRIIYVGVTCATFKIPHVAARGACTALIQGATARGGVLTTVLRVQDCAKSNVGKLDLLRAGRVKDVAAS
jgi:tetratricopeptide (TPR) repeat protein